MTHPSKAAAAAFLSNGTGVAWEEGHFSTVALYNTPFNVTWVLGKGTKANGEHYQDIVAVAYA